jgi:hypothetical protein
MGWQGTIGYSVSVVRISTVTGGKAGYNIRRIKSILAVIYVNKQVPETD